MYSMPNIVLTYEQSIQAITTVNISSTVSAGYNKIVWTNKILLFIRLSEGENNVKVNA